MKSTFRSNTIKKPTNIIFNIIFIILSLSCIIPLVFILAISFTSEGSIEKYGYSFWPHQWSLLAYEYVMGKSTQLLSAYGVSIFTTVVGAALGVFFNATYGYVLSRSKFKFNKFYTYMILITMFFNGGMIAFYLVVTRVLNLQDNLLAIILPGSVTAFYIIIMRTFFKQSVPESCIESASIDGASQYRIFFQIVIPMSLPAVATIGLFLTIGFWNSWFNALLFISRPELMPLQEFMMNLLTDLSFLQANTNTMGSANLTAISQLPQESAQMAVVVLATVPIVIAYPFFQRYFVSGLTIGAVKG